MKGTINEDKPNIKWLSIPARYFHLKKIVINHWFRQFLDYKLNSTVISNGGSDERM